MFGFVLFVLYDTDAGSQVTGFWSAAQNCKSQCFTKWECWHAALYWPLSAPQQIGVLTCGSLWANVSYSINGSVDMRLFMGQCQLLNKGSVDMWLLVSQCQLLKQNGSTDMRLFMGQCQGWRAAPYESMSAPQEIRVLTCGSLWVNVSSSINRSVGMRLFSGSMSAL